MMPPDLAQLSMAELTAHLAEVTAELQRRAMSPEEKRRQQTAERTRRWRERQRHETPDGDAACDAPVTHSTEQTASQRDASVTQAVTFLAAAAPMVSPGPPSFPASSPTPTPAHVRPTVQQVLDLMNANTNCRIPTEDRAEVAQAYLDARNRTDPPWILPGDHDRPARVVGENWQADCRIFCRNWQDVLTRSRARETARNGVYANSANRARAEPDTTPLTVDAAIWRAFVTSPDHPEYRSLATQPVPKTEADISVNVMPDWKRFKRSKSTPN